MLESLSIGLAVAVSETVGLASFVETNKLGWVVKLNSQEIRTSLTDAYENPQRIASIRRTAPSVIKAEFNEKEITSRYVNFIRINLINEHFSFIVLTLNEEQHLPRLLQSIKPLKAKVYVLDSGSTDQTLSICHKYQLEVKHHLFYNHPKQWDVALRSFDIKTPWVICLDADQILSPKLTALLQDFRDSDYSNVNGIYFNRKNYFKGKWIRFGGYYPKYLLKMFRYQIGYSDLQENMDHRFQVKPETAIWKTGYLIEENLKENEIRFWIEKHNRYSDLLAEEEIQRIQKTRCQETKPKFWGSQRKECMVQKHMVEATQIPSTFSILHLSDVLPIRSLDGTKGMVFHFLQGFWFRLIVDIKINEKLETGQRAPVRFTFSFLMLFISFYAFNLLYIGLTTPGDYYIDQIAYRYNYIRIWRNFCLSSTSSLLKSLGIQSLHNRNSTDKIMDIPGLD